MGYVQCTGFNVITRIQKHSRPVRCCWRCEKCPKCSGEFSKLLKGDYCPSCTIELRNKGLIWSQAYGNYVDPEKVNKEVLEREKKYLEPFQGELFNPQKPLL